MLELSFFIGSAYSLPFESDSFDLIVCSEVLEHLHEYNDAIKEIHRVLKPGGKFYASVPASWPEKICWSLSKEYQNQPGGHLRIFNQNNLVDEIEGEGFKFLSSERFIQFIVRIGG
jgi:ubiquinone/menaquinone biosynthesis C-methylase UbiE